MLALFIIVSIIAIFIFLFRAQAKERANDFEQFLVKHNITPNTTERFFDGKHLIYDEDTDMLWLYNEKNEHYVGANRESVLGCEVKIDDETEHRTSISSAAGRAVIGGVLLGGLGAIVGGVTARKKSNHLVHKITLTIYFNINEPFSMDIETFSDVQGSKLTDGYYQNSYNRTIAWSKFIESYMH